MNRTGTPITITTLSVAINTRTAELRNTRPPMVGTDPGLASRREQLIAERATLVAARSELRQSRRTQSGSAAADRTLIAAARPILEADELATRMTTDEVHQGIVAAMGDLTVDDEQAQPDATVTPAHLERVLDAVDGVLHVIDGREVYAGTSISGGAYMTFLVENLSAGQDEVKMTADEVRQWVEGVGGDLAVAAEALTASLS